MKAMIQSVSFKFLACNLLLFHTLCQFSLKMISWFYIILRAKEKLSEEATRYLQDFPGEMIFHTNNLHLLETIGQGKIKCVTIYLHTSSVLKYLLCLIYWDLITVVVGEFGIVYRARLTRPTLKKTECEIVAVKTIKGEDTINLTCIQLEFACHTMSSCHKFTSAVYPSKPSLKWFF